MASVEDLIKNRPGFEAMCPANLDKAIEIQPNIWMSTGTSNAYMVVTEKNRIIINTGMGFEALTHKKIFDDICTHPTSHILLTQGHVDHVGGVKLFKEKNTCIIAQKNNAVCQQDDERIQKIRSSQAYIWFQSTIDKAIEVASIHPEALIQDKPIPDTTFDNNYCFQVDDISFQLLATPGGETIDSCVVWLPKNKILFSGNLFGPLFPHFPNINTLRGDKYRYLEPYLESLQSVRKLKPETLITGHFEPIQGTKLIQDCLNRLEGAVQFIHAETLKGMNAGKDIFTLMQETKLPQHLIVGEGYGKVSWAVRTLWESYMGWFKAQSTSELYADVSKDAYQELVNLAGIKSTLEKATEKLSDNNVEVALLLTEAILCKENNNIKALKLSLKCHQKLLDQSHSNNFWETGWLKHQILILNKKLT